jgi:hypothetical protein
MQRDPIRGKIHASGIIGNPADDSGGCFLIRGLPGR